jgi:hypothetical protein
MKPPIFLLPLLWIAWATAGTMSLIDGLADSFGGH